MFEKIGEIDKHAGAVYDISFHNNFIFSVSADGFVARWFLDSLLQDSFAIKCSTPPYCLTFDTINGNLWFGLSNGDLHVINVESKIELKFFQQHKSGLFSLNYLKQKKLIAAGDGDGNLSIWNSNSLELLLILPLNCGKIRKIEFSPDGKLMSVNGLDGKIRIFETVGFNEIKTLPGHENGACCSFFSSITSNEIRLISGGKDGHLKEWDCENLKLIQSVPAHNFAIYDLISVNENQNFISASRDKTIKIWNSFDLSFLQKLDAKSGGHKHSVNSLLKIDENRFISCSDDKKIIFWAKSSK